MFIGVSRGEEFLPTLHPLFTTLHHSSPARRSCGFEIRRQKRLDLFLADLKSASNEIAFLPPVLLADCKSAIVTHTAADCKSAEAETARVKSGEEWVKSAQTLFTPRNADKH